MTFSDFNFEPSLLEGLTSMGYVKPTPIQEQTIPIILEGKDLIACAQTGTGKTASYLLPVIQKMSQLEERHLHTLILSPTRELAQQIDQQVEGLAYFTGISSIAVYGGGDGMIYENQRKAIIEGADIMIATPGRLISFLVSGVVKFDHLESLVLDEADRMLDMGFYDDILKIISYLPTSRQTMLFSATMPPRIRELAKKILKDPQQVNISISQPAAGIDQQAYMAYDEQKNRLLQKILAEGSYPSVLIFSSTKEKVKSLHNWFKKMGMPAEAFSSDLEQDERERILRAFKARQLPVIIGTDVLSRGIDVEGISLVLNYDVPPDPEDYIHRIGRTARAETTGTAITFINEKDQRKFQSIELLIGREIVKSPLPEELGTAPEYHPTGRKAISNRSTSDQTSNNSTGKGKKKSPKPAKKLETVETKDYQNTEESTTVPISAKEKNAKHTLSSHKRTDDEIPGSMNSDHSNPQNGIEESQSDEITGNLNEDSLNSSNNRKPGRKGKSSARSRPPHKAGDPRPEPIPSRIALKKSNETEDAKTQEGAHSKKPSSNRLETEKTVNGKGRVDDVRLSQKKSTQKKPVNQRSATSDHKAGKTAKSVEEKTSPWDWLFFWKKK